MPSKFGGVPMEGQDQPSQSRFGGVPVGASEQPPEQIRGLPPGQQPPGVPSPRFPQPTSAIDAGLGVAAGLNPIPMLRAAAHPIDTFNADAANRRKLRDQGMQDDKAGNTADSVQHLLGGTIPIIGPWLSNSLDAMIPTNNQDFNSYDAGRALGQAIQPALIPPAIKGVGKAMQRGAEPVMDTALGIRNVDRAQGQKSGRAALDLTSGFSPSAISASAKTKIGELARKRDAALIASPNKVSGAPAIAGVDARIAKAQAGNSIPSDLIPIREHLTAPHPGFAGDVSYSEGSNTPIKIDPGFDGFPTQVTPGKTPPLTISELQNPMNALSIRQRLGEDFTKFDHARPLSKEQLRVGNEAYGNYTRSIHSAVPESAPYDRNIANLMPVSESAHVRELNAGTPQRILGRLAAHTGALTGAAAGYSHGGIPGGVLGLIVPELLASPTFQAAAARGITRTGKMIHSPFITRPAQAIPFVKPRDQ